MLLHFESAQMLARKRARQSRFLPAVSGARSIDLVVAATSYARGKEVYGEGEPAEFVYKVESGCIKTYNIFDDGRRHIGGFYMRGDYIAIEASKVYGSCADTVTPSFVKAINRKMLMASAAKNPALLKHLLNVTAFELRRSQDHNRLLLKSAQERVVSFLLEIACRAPRLSRIDLPMTRQDIGDHLGLTIETVSRVLSHLGRTSIISMRSRHCIVIQDLAALNRLVS